MNGEYRNVRQLLRPARAVIAYDAESDWQAGVRASVRAASRWWGGAGDVLLPLRAGGPVTDLLTVLRRYDPDVICWVRTSVADLSPAEHSKFLADTMATGADPAQAATAAEITEVGTWPEPTALTDLASAWFAHCAPYGDDVLLVGSNETPEPFAEASQVSERPFATLDLTQVSPTLGLLLASKLGDEAPGTDSIRLPVTERELVATVNLAFFGPERLLTPTSWVEAFDQTGHTDPARLLPLARTLVGVGAMTRGRGSHVLVVGDAPDDHALSVAYDRSLAGGATWLPMELLTAENAEGSAVRAALHRRFQRPVGSRASHDGTVLVTSSSLPLGDLASLVEDTSVWTVGPHITLTIVGPADVPLGPSKILAVPDSLAYNDAYDTSTSVDGTIATRPGLPARRPTGDAAAVGSWYVDAQFTHAPPTPSRLALADLVVVGNVGSYAETLARAGRDGAAYWCRTQGFRSFAMPDDMSLVRPQLRLPSPFEVFAALADASGSVAGLSPAGRRARNVVQLWGDLALVTSDLKGSTRKLLDAFTHDGDDGPYDHGVCVRHTGYLTFEHAEKATDSEEEPLRALLDRLLECRVLHRGLLLRCARCERLDFYRIAHVGETFTCQQCEHMNALTRERWRHPRREPSWFYDLDPLVRDLLTQHGDVPILAVERLRGLGPDGQVGSSFEIDLTRHGEKKPWVELDIAALVGTRIVVGEAKSNNTLQTGEKSVTQAAARLVQAAAELTADTLVLATTQSAWAPGVEPAVRKALAALPTDRPRPDLILLADVR